MKYILGLTVIPLLLTTATAFADLSSEAEKVMQLRKSECEADILLDTCANDGDVPAPTCIVKATSDHMLIFTYKFFRDSNGRTLPNFETTIGNK